MSFIPIEIDAYLDLHMQENPKEDRKELRLALLEALAESRAGSVCYCGNPIWILGSAFVGHACFTCITGEATPDADYEIVGAGGRHVNERRKHRRQRAGATDNSSHRNRGDRK